MRSIRRYLVRVKPHPRAGEVPRAAPLRRSSTPATRAVLIAVPSNVFFRRRLGGQICVLTVRVGPDAGFQRVGADGRKLLTAATVRIVGDRPRVGSREAFEKLRFRHRDADYADDADGCAPSVSGAIGFPVVTTSRKSN